MKYLIDQYPEYCPCCGQNNSGYKHEEMHDFNSGNSFACNSCNSKFQKLTSEIEAKIKDDLCHYFDR